MIKRLTKFEKGKNNSMLLVYCQEEKHWIPIIFDKPATKEQAFEYFYQNRELIERNILKMLEEKRAHDLIIKKKILKKIANERKILAK